jgi:hypothetical protein
MCVAIAENADVTTKTGTLSGIAINCISLPPALQKELASIDSMSITKCENKT